tara:strand:- start:141 stop:485 length:345 start_codon:yes stop_codon:yes gene_type:complete
MAGSNIARHKSGTIIATVNPATGSAQALVAAAAANVKIRVVWLALNCAGGANTVQFNSATTAIMPLMGFATLESLVLPYNPNGWFETAANEALNCTLGSGTAVGMQIGYVHSTV